MAYSKPLNETVSAIQSKLRAKNEMSSTLGWDVVANYSIDTINKLLEETFKSKDHKHITDVRFDVYAPDRDGDLYGIHYYLELAAPRIEFNPRSAEGPSCDLLVPVVSGTVKIDDSKKPDPVVPPGVYTLVLSNLKLATAKGHWDDKPDHSGEPFVFRDRGDQGCVVIDLPTSNQLTVNLLKDSTGISSIDNYLPAVKESIQNIFLTDGIYSDIRLEIARVNSTSPAGSYQLCPKSFLFDAFLPSDKPEAGGKKDVGVLTLFIQTRDINHGRRNELFTSWQNQWRVILGCSPIPTGETASILFSKEMIYESAIKPVVEAHGFKERRIDDGYFIKTEIDTVQSVHRDRMRKTVEVTTCNVDPVNVTIPPFQLELTERNSSGGSTITWKFDYSYSWYRTINLGRQSPPRLDGKVTVTNSVTEKYQKAYLDDHHLVIYCSVSPSDWEVGYRGEVDDSWQRLVSDANWFPDWAKIEVKPSSLEIKLADVDFLLTTNLLFPDNKRVIDVNRQAGLRIPGDLYFVGKIVAK